ncbi:hypothetical protein ACFOEP_12875 [Microbacterium amylolyticum]|uniref:hypothetical protein n=1 Tax=Microbacterium amylolyticum TaxID=936337 RepID=UPI003613B86B
MPGVQDLCCGGVDLAGVDILIEAHHAHIECGFTAVATDFEHVVDVGRDFLVGHRIRTLGDVVDVRAQLRAWRDGVDQRSTLSVGAYRQLGHRQIEILARFHVGGDVPHAEHLGYVLERREARLHPEFFPAGGCDFDFADGLAERCCPLVEDA